jgi:SPP1 family predicted phage head-tail adaptor
MNSGKRRRRISIQQRNPATPPDSFGQPADDWVEVTPAWAWIKGVSGVKGLEVSSNGISVSTGRYSMRIRYREDLTSAMRVVLNGEIYNIQGVLPDRDGRQYVDLVCEIGANQG